jgi:murein L,D-transpeptidase YafK
MLSIFTKHLKVILAVLLASLALLLFLVFGRAVWYPLYLEISGRKTVADIEDEIGEKVEKRLSLYFKKLNSKYVPDRIVLIGYKKERILELWAPGKDNRFVMVKNYKIMGASGTPGPKLREGDMQVPEGIYTIVGLNPNSEFYLSMGLDYPNRFDMKMAQADGRDNPGSDIAIHGRIKSVGCLAIGDEAIEDLFILAAKAGIGNIRVIISPDKKVEGMRNNKIPWVPQLYDTIKNEIARVTMTGKKSK